MDREIHERHAAWLRTLLRIGDGEPLPDKAVDGYWQLKRICDRISSDPSLSELTLLVYSLGYGQTTESEHQADSSVRGLKPYAPVQVKWRNGVVDAVFLTDKGREVVVEFSDGTQRTLAADRIILPELEPVA